MKIQIITLFPNMFREVLDTSMLLKAQKTNSVEFKIINLRDYGLNLRKNVDDRPYGGGLGMIIRIEPISDALEAAKKDAIDSKVILLSPRGKTFKQSIANQMAKFEDLIFICPHYEGYDERIVDLVDYVISVGNFVVTGGELPAMLVIDSIVRLLPGVLRSSDTIENESFYHNDKDIEHPQYTRPEIYKGSRVPEVLISGNHEEIARYREQNSNKKAIL